MKACKAFFAGLAFLLILLAPEPACGATMSKHVIANPEVRFVVWGDQPNAATTLEADWYSLFANGVFDRLAEYGVHGGTLGPTTQAQPDLAPSVYDDAWVTQQLLSEIIPVPNTIWVVVLPPGSTTVGLQASHASGYHFWGVVPYAIVPGEGEILISHEIYEAATDPDGLGYRWGEKEIGDYCEGQVDEIGGVWVQKVWSVKEGACL